MLYFIAYPTSARTQIFALSIDSTAGIPAPNLELVTTVGGDHLGLVPDLLNSLNHYLQTQAHPDEDMQTREEPMHPDLDMFPEAVARSIRRYLESKCATPSYGEWSWRGPIYSVPDYVDRLRSPQDTADLYEFMRGPNPGEVELPVRLENAIETRWRGGKYWDLDGRTDTPDVGYDDPRPGRWSYPDGLTPEMVWTSWIIGELNEKHELIERKLRDGVQLAMAAHDADKRVRIHPVTVWIQNAERDEDGFSTGGIGSNGWIVEVFDSPITDYTDLDEEEETS
ncbi:hypothetical protein ACFVMC_20685 [Nocardia sp. NPDC127579]|uniref:hypothetical protein n=1 Tax=Nocardia sp. NPDC127579 TaxID=3345402 RepID=UPI00363E8090